MPRYDYACRDCEHTTSLSAAMTDSHPEMVGCLDCTEELLNPEGGSWCYSCIAMGLRRVYGVSGINLGFRPHVHDQNDEFKFKHL